MSRPEERSHRGEGGPATRRRAAHAGSFYTRDPANLGREVETLLRDAFAGRSSVDAGTPRLSDGPNAAPVGLMVPHAGLRYSGAVAARGWIELSAIGAGSIVVAGTNHYAGWLNGVGVWSGAAWETPLGDCPVDDVLSRRIEALGPPFVATVEAHLDEHSIEVQLPLVVRACPAARIVPLLVGTRRASDSVEAGRRLGALLSDRKVAGETIAIVASSDLAHYPSASIARDVDRRVLEPICALNTAELESRETEVRSAGIRDLACGLCGLEPVLLTLAAVREMGASRGILLAHATSADAGGGDPERVVGYASVAFIA